MSFFQSRKPFQCQIHTSCFHGRCFLTERQERDSNTKNTFDTTRNATLEDIHFVQLLLPKPHISFCWTSGCIFFLTQLRTVDFVPHHFKWKCFKRDFFVFGLTTRNSREKNSFNVHLALWAFFWDRLEIWIYSLKWRTTRHRARGEPRHVLNESPWTLLENSL